MDLWTQKKVILSSQPLTLQCKETSAMIYMVEKIVSFVPPILLATFLGPWSDVHGRRLPFLLPYVGTMLSTGFFLAASRLESGLVLTVVMVGFLIRSFSGHFILLHLISFTYIADVVRCSDTYSEIGGLEVSSGNGNSRRRKGIAIDRDDHTPRDRGVAVEVAGREDRGQKDQGEILASMCRLQVAESMGTVAGAALAWVLQKANGETLALSLGAGVIFPGALVVAFCFGDDITGNRACGVEDGALSTRLRRLREVFCWGQVGVDSVRMWGSMLLVLLMMVCTESRDTVTIPFMMSYPLFWSRSMFSAYVACFNLFQSVFLLLLAPLMKGCNVVVLAMLCSLVGGLWTAFCSSTWTMMLAGCLSHMADCLFPALKAILCKDLPLHQVGKVLSRLSLAEGLGITVGPVLIVQLYNSTLLYFPGIAFLATSAIPCILLLLGALLDCFHSTPGQPSGKDFLSPELDPCHGSCPSSASSRVDFTQSLNVPSTTVSGYGFLWCSTDW